MPANTCPACGQLLIMHHAAQDCTPQNVPVPWHPAQLVVPAHLDFRAAAQTR